MSENFQKLLMKLIENGRADPQLLNLINQAGSNPEQMAEISAHLAKVAQGLEEPLIMEDFYDDGDGSKYQLLWDIGPANPLSAVGISFDHLDRKTQFFTLFAEWQRRGTEGMMELKNGQLDQAESTFKECLDRAEQIKVDELRARSYEDLARVADKRGPSGAGLKWLEKALEVRQPG
jgi:hypothetical protein